MVRVLERHFATVDHINKFCPDPDFNTIQKDFLLYTPKKSYDFIITNPPFRKALEFVLHALSMNSKCVAMLCRLAFLESGTRYMKLFRKNPPSRVMVFVNRASMSEGVIDESASSATCYAWFVWDRREVFSGTRVEWIDDRNPKENESQENLLDEVAV